MVNKTKWGADSVKYRHCYCPTCWQNTSQSQSSRIYPLVIFQCSMPCMAGSSGHTDGAEDILKVLRSDYSHFSTIFSRTCARASASQKLFVFMHITQRWFRRMNTPGSPSSIKHQGFSIISDRNYRTGADLVGQYSIVQAPRWL